MTWESTTSTTGSHIRGDSS
ncbi:hypothetical protein LINPERPRIM_LOCUS16775 [Linum perenne]